MKKLLSNFTRIICIAILGIIVLQVLFTLIINIVSDNKHEQDLIGEIRQIEDPEVIGLIVNNMDT